jgi:hypothetical protein
MKKNPNPKKPQLHEKNPNPKKPQLMKKNLTLENLGRRKTLTLKTSADEKP